MAEPKVTETPEVESKIKKPVIATVGPAQMTFPQLMGHVVTLVLADRTLMPQGKHDIEIWYNAQNPESRRDLARKVRQEIEYVRAIVESSFMHFVSIAFKDLS